MLATDNEQLKPQFFELAEMEKDVTLCHHLDAIIARQSKLLRQLIDTRDQAGHEAYASALEIYSTTKRATTRGIAGAEMAYEELKMMFSMRAHPQTPSAT